MHINYKIKEFVKNVFVVEVPNMKHRSMLFLRAEEFYESPNPRFKGKNFDVSEYLEWYSKSKYASKKNNIESYIYDWDGFNIPYDVAARCYKKLKSRPDLMTPYDLYFYDILKFVTKHKDPGKAYIICTSKFRSRTTLHELHHAMYYLDKNYRKDVHKFLRKIPIKTLKELKNILFDLGYAKKVLYDELMTYLMVH